MPNTQALKKAKSPTLKEQGRFKAFFSNNLFIILAFLVPFVLMTTAFALMKVSPFGDQQILVTDLWHQYFPFLVDFQDKLKHGESLFWSWTQAVFRPTGATRAQAHEENTTQSPSLAKKHISRKLTSG